MVNDVAECSAEDGADLRDTCLRIGHPEPTGYRLRFVMFWTRLDDDTGRLRRNLLAIRRRR